MITLPVELGERSYPVHLAPGGLAQWGEIGARYLRGPALLVSDGTVDAAQGEAVRAQLEAFVSRSAVHILPEGEASKSLATLERLYEALHAMRMPREGTIVALGGGVVGDLAGFAAATWRRGINWIALPTSLVAMVDAHLGGKVGVNFQGKNLVGAFHQPRMVLIDPHALRTLPARESQSGLGEILKTACLDAEFFGWLAEAWQALLAYEERTLETAIARAVKVKIAIVEADERELGPRRTLNLGHTLGHALEAASEGGFCHGACVAAGLWVACALAGEHPQADRDYLGLVQDLSAALGAAGPQLPEFRGLVPFLQQDKKATADGTLRWVLPLEPGRVEVVEGVTGERIQESWEAYLAAQRGAISAA